MRSSAVGEHLPLLSGSAMVGTPAALGPLGAVALVALLPLAGEGLGALSPAGDGRHAPPGGDAALPVERDDRAVAQRLDLLLAAQPRRLLGLVAALGREPALVEGHEHRVQRQGRGWWAGGAGWQAEAVAGPGGTQRLVAGAQLLAGLVDADRGGAPPAPGTTGVSRDDLVVGALVTLSDPANPSGTFAWTLAAKPPGSAATLSGATGSTATFTPDVPGTYLVELVANGSASYTTGSLGVHVPIGNQGGCGVKFRNDLRAPAAGETTQFDTTGWNPALYSAILAVPRVLQGPGRRRHHRGDRAGQARRRWGGRIHLPEGRFEISDTMRFPQIAGMSIVGAGIRSTQLVWTGADGIPMFDFNRCQDCGLSNVSVEVDAAAALLCVARFYNSTTPLTGTYVVPHQFSARDFIEHCFFELGGRADDGIQIVLESTDPGDPPPVDGKNDQHRFTKVHIRGYTEAAVVIEGQASLDNRFEGCVFQGGGIGKVGIDTRRNPRGAGTGSFSMAGGVIMDHTEADFDLTRSNGPITITGVWSEHSARLMRVADYSADDPAQVERFAVAIDGMRWSSSSSEIAADGEIIQFTASGPLDVNALTVGAQTETLPFRIRFQPCLEQVVTC